MVDTMIANIPDIVTGDTFKAEMKRFLPTDVHDRTLGKDKFEAFLITSVHSLLQDARQHLNGDHTEPEFHL